MAITERPYVGSWSLNNKQVIKHTPDVLVYINGDTAVPGCPSCNGRIDIQQFITSVSVDPSTSPMATGNISLQIPRHYGDSLLRDGQFILRPGLEIHIYMRGYFPVAGAFSDVSSSQTGGVDVSGAYVYPYYHVFHGVVTEVSHEYNGGEHTVTINLVDLLHFWQYQRLSTNGAAFGLKIENSKVRMSLMGNTFAGMTPYSIIYNLYRDIAGAAGGVDFALGNESNAAARSTTFQEGLWSMTINYWKKRFSEHMTSLRMYGVDGTLYNAFEQSFLSTKKAQSALLDVRLSDKTLQSVEKRDKY